MPAAANGTPNSTPPSGCSPKAASASPTSSSSRSPIRPRWPPAARDTTRRRRNFDLHVQLVSRLRDWYHAVEQLDPRRVRWELPATGIPDTTLGPRDDGTRTNTFDALISQLPAR